MGDMTLYRGPAIMLVSANTAPLFPPITVPLAISGIILGGLLAYFDGRDPPDPPEPLYGSRPKDALPWYRRKT